MVPVRTCVWTRQLEICEIYTSKPNVSAQTVHRLHMHGMVESFKSYQVVF